MDLFTIASIIIALSALFGFVNVRFLKLPNTIGLMIMAIVFTLVIFASTLFTDRFLLAAQQFIGQVDFPAVLLDVMLGFLLFAGAMHTNFDQLRVQRWPVLAFATVGILTSTFLVGIMTWIVFNLMGLEVHFIHCLLFGALISPTDPIAVLGILKKARVPKKLETKIVGESLFNDGVGVVVFLTIFSIATGGGHPGGHEGHGHEDHAHHTIVEPANAMSLASYTPDAADEPVADTDESEHADTQPVVTKSLMTTVRDVLTLFGTEVLGGIALGLVLGTVTYLLLRSIDDYEIEVMITLACVMGGYSLAAEWHLSAPLAMVVAGLIVGNDTVRGTSMSKQTEIYVDKFWELVDILLNAILFVLIGFELLILEITSSYVYAGLVAIVIVLIARYLSLLAPVHFFAKRLDFVPHTATIMAWGGLRGGISIALALRLTPEMNRDLFLTATYGVVIFSIIVQGLTVGALAKRMIGINNESEVDDPVSAH
ncbi:sodium:proton antiporter [Mariniblastus sp.]|nr:sodium:proton antiporter [Mariniblastus sp.]